MREQGSLLFARGRRRGARLARAATMLPIALPKPAALCSWASAGVLGDLGVAVGHRHDGRFAQADHVAEVGRRP